MEENPYQSPAVPTPTSSQMPPRFRWWQLSIIAVGGLVFPPFGIALIIGYFLVRFTGKPL